MASHPSPSAARLHRDRDGRLIAGVCAGLGRHLGVDPLLVRVAFVVAAAAGGLGVAIYALAWLMVPTGDGPATVGRLRTGRAGVEVALGTGLLLLSVLLAVRGAGLWFSDVLVWPLVLVAAGGALLWRQGLGGGGGAQTVVSDPLPATAAPPVATPRARAETVSRTGLGVALVIAAGLAFLQATGALSAARDVLLAAIVVAIVLAVILAPWIVRLVRSLAAERSTRIRSQERAELAAHLHDSVLQTLALMQQRADDPAQVATLARRQERELRAWLADRAPADAQATLTTALEAVAVEVEHVHRVAVEVVVVGGDEPLDGAGEALVAAAREAIVNAAKFGAGSPVSVYAEAGEDALAVFVRDRGPGFDQAEIPPDRRGVRESIVGRMARHGGRASVRSIPGEGTEVELVLPTVPGPR